MGFFTLGRVVKKGLVEELVNADLHILPVQEDRQESQCPFAIVEPADWKGGDRS